MRLLTDALTLAQALVGLAVDGPDRCQRLVAGVLCLRARIPQKLLSLLLGREHAVLGGTVGLGDALAGAHLGLLAQLIRGAFGRLDDAGDVSGGGAWGVG